MEEEKKEGKGRSTYLVFREVDVEDGTAWSLEGTAHGHNGLDAIKEIVKGYGAEMAQGTFAAVPRANFHAHTVRVETVQQVTVE